MIKSPTVQELAGMLDHALLRPDLTEQEFEAGILLARDAGVASVCIQPWYLKRCVELLAGSTVLPSTVVGFPHGGHTRRTKIAEARQALEEGARELDMVVNIAAVRSSQWMPVAQEIWELAETCRTFKARSKIIFETCYLDESQKIRLCEICSGAGVDWVKTSTGFGSAGATDCDIALMRRHCPERVQIKASGGVRTLSRVLELRALGVTRIGTSSTSAILKEARGVDA